MHNASLWRTVRASRTLRCISRTVKGPWRLYRAGQGGLRSCSALQKNMENLTDRQPMKLRCIAGANRGLHRAQMRKAGRQTVFRVRVLPGRRCDPARDPSGHSVPGRISRLSPNKSVAAANIPFCIVDFKNPVSATAIGLQHGSTSARYGGRWCRRSHALWQE